MATDDGKNIKGAGGIQSLERASAILDSVAGNPAGIGLTDISHNVGLHPSTAFHLIKTMVSLGFLTQDSEGKKYRIGTRLFALASGASRERALLNLATPLLAELSAETGESSHLAVRSRAEVLVVAKMEGAGMLQMSERVGLTRPIHATAIGKAMLAFMPDRPRDELIATLPLTKITPATITDPEALRAEMRAIRREGVAHDRTEFDPDLRCIAMPIHDFTGNCVAAVGLSGPVWRMTPETVEIRIRQLARTAAELSQGLGYRPQVSETLDA